MIAFTCLLAACGSTTTVTQEPDNHGCYPLGMDPDSTFACSPGCSYVAGSSMPYFGPIVMDPCLHVCHSNGRLSDTCQTIPNKVTADAGQDVVDVSFPEDVPADGGLLEDVSVDVGADVFTDVPTDVSTGRCASNNECDDHDGMTEDVCNTSSGICSHTRTVVETPPFDPMARQNLTNLCEMPIACPTGNTVLLRTTCSGAIGNTTWSEQGYPLALDVTGPLAGPILRIAPRLSIGDPRDHFRVVVAIGYTSPAIIDRTMSVAEIEHGFEVNVGTPGQAVRITFLPAGASMLSRSLQWDLPPGSITSGDGHAETTCLQVGYTMLIPQHGFLHLEEQLGGRLGCTGTPLRADAFGGIGVTWARSFSNPTLFYVNAPPVPWRYLYEFADTRESIGWINPSTTLYNLCASVLVADDETFAIFMRTLRHESIGLRPGLYVTWTDARGVSHRGITDRRFTILEASWPSDQAHLCSLYSVFTGRVDGTCPLDITTLMSRYTVTTPPIGMTLNPRAMFNDAQMVDYNR